MYLASYNISTNTLFTGQTVVFLPKCPSTNDVAATLARTTRPAEGTLVWAGEQTAGRGQQGTQWHTQAQANVTCSLLFYPQWLALPQAWLLAVVGAVAAQRTVAQLAGLAPQPHDANINNKQTAPLVQIKWPNDILLNGKKCCGLLIENQLEGSRLRHSVFGIGINVNQVGFDIPHATSLATETGQTLPLETVLARLCENLEAAYLQLQRGQHQQLLDQYLSHLAGYQQWRSYTLPDGSIITAFLHGLSPAGRLQLRHQDGKTHEYEVKEVHWIYDADQPSV